MTEQPDQRRTDAVALLERASDGDTLQGAAIELAASAEPEWLAPLGAFLSRRDGLARLDDLGQASTKTTRLARVFRAIEAHPSMASADLCLRLVDDPEFLADDDRKIHLLPALAAVRPMSEPAVEVFRRTNAEGYESLNAPLLVKNGSEPALRLFEAMICDNGVPGERRVDMLHRAVLPYRILLPVLHAVDRVLACELDQVVVIGAIETIFDYRPGEWFGTGRFQPTPPPWEEASDEALDLVLVLADRVRDRLVEQASLQQAVDDTVASVRQLLQQRKA